MKKTDVSTGVADAFDVVITERFNQHIATDTNISNQQEALSAAIKKFRNSLSDEQKSAFTQLENMEVAVEVAIAERYYRIGWTDAVVTGGYEMHMLDNGMKATKQFVMDAAARDPEVKRAANAISAIIYSLKLKKGIDGLDAAINEYSAACISSGFRFGVAEGLLLSDKSGKPNWLESIDEQEPIPEPDPFEWKPDLKDLINSHTTYLDNRMHEIGLSLHELEAVDHDDDRVKSTAVYRLLKKELDMLSTSVMFVERVREALDY